MKYKCYLCGKNIQTNDIFATISTQVENEQDIIGSNLLCEKICSICAYRFEYWRKKILELARTDKK